MHVERTFTVPRPPTEVFDYLADFTHTEEWDPGTVETRRTSGDGGVGTTYDNVSDFMGRRVELTYETVAHERPTRLQFRGNRGQTYTTDTITLAAAGEGTSVHYRADIDLGVMRNLVAPFYQRRLERLADDTVELLQGVLSEPT
jgi:carbon monoxide dehydrogenase subunit G